MREEIGRGRFLGVCMCSITHNTHTHSPVGSPGNLGRVFLQSPGGAPMQARSREGIYGRTRENSAKKSAVNWGLLAEFWHVLPERNEEVKCLMN
jgi:hypothetical protein